MTKEDKPDAWMPARRVKRGSTLRIELHLSNLDCHTAALSCSEYGVLMRLLVAEAVGETIAFAVPKAVKEAFEWREDYRRIKGGLARTGLSPAKRAAVFERDGGSCVYCGQNVAWADYHCDHVEPVSKGGSDDLGNLTTSCRSCNLSKKDKPLSEWRGL